MAVPKRKTSKQRKHKRTANWKVGAVTLTQCPQCHEMKASHRVCKHCGYYDGKLVVAQEAKKAE